MTLSINQIAIAAVAVALASGCSKNDNDSSSAGTTGAPAVKGTPGATNSAMMGSGMTDANIFYALDVTHMGDSAKGALATTKGTSAEVRDFARMMVRDHHTMRVLGQNLSKRLAMEPTPPPGNSLPAKLDSVLSQLNAAAKGRDFDKAYMDHEVAAHREALTIVTSAMGVTRNSEIKNLIQNAAPMLQAHMDKAQAVQKNLQK